MTPNVTLDEYNSCCFFLIENYCVEVSSSIYMLVSVKRFTIDCEILPWLEEECLQTKKERKGQETYLNLLNYGPLADIIIKIYYLCSVKTKLKLTQNNKMHNGYFIHFLFCLETSSVHFMSRKTDISQEPIQNWSSKNDLISKILPKIYHFSMNNLELAAGKYHFYGSWNERLMFWSETKIVEKTHCVNWFLS